MCNVSPLHATKDINCVVSCLLDVEDASLFLILLNLDMLNEQSFKSYFYKINKRERERAF